MLQKWVIYWSRGPMDNPVDGRAIIEAKTAFDAASKFDDDDAVDAVIREDLDRDFAPGILMTTKQQERDLIEPPNWRLLFYTLAGVAVLMFALLLIYAS